MQIKLTRMCRIALIATMMLILLSGVDMRSPIIQDTKRFQQDFDRLQKTAASDQQLFDQMTELYPNWVANQS